MSLKELTEQQKRILNDLQIIITNNIYKKFCDHFSRCESPIEELLLGTMILYADDYGISVDVYCEPMDTDPRWSLLDSFPDKITIYPQKVINNYRVDFLIKAEEAYGHGCYDLVNLIVECDGHEFHEKTKEQAKKDKKRDRELQAMGYPVYRFTGSEIFKKPKECVQSIFEFMANQLDIVRRKRMGL